VLGRLIQFSLTQRLLMLVLTAMLVAAGVYAFSGLPIDAFPDVSSTQVKIILKAPGMTPEEVETRIAVPVEQEMLGIPRQRLLRSTSKYALNWATLDFEDGTDIYWARQQVGERLAGVMGNLPAGASGGLAPITTPLGEMFMFTIEGPISLQEKRTLLDWTIRPQLRTLPGVADVHDLHVWAMSTTDIALSAHLVMPGGHPGDAFLAGIADELHTRFHITHPTIQIELDGLDHGCAHPTGNSMS
jgi:cobalt-zinc-cadmium resistance protein CzcA